MHTNINDNNIYFAENSIGICLSPVCSENQFTFFVQTMEGMPDELKIILSKALDYLVRNPLLNFVIY